MDKSNIILKMLVYQDQVLEGFKADWFFLQTDWLIFNVFSIFRSEDNIKFTADKRRQCAKSNKTAAAHPCPAFLNNRAMEGEESRVKELGMGRLGFFGHLERVERMRCYWELKHVQLQTLEQVTLQKNARHWHTCSYTLPFGGLFEWTDILVYSSKSLYCVPSHRYVNTTVQKFDIFFFWKK